MFTVALRVSKSFKCIIPSDERYKYNEVDHVQNFAEVPKLNSEILWIKTFYRKWPMG